MSVLYLALLLAGITWSTGGALDFKKTPNDTEYFMKGSDAILKWEYSVVNRKEELQFVIWKAGLAPLMYEDTNGTFQISAGIPAEYKGRVERKDQATLVIKNISFADTGDYSCVLQEMPGKPSGPTSLVRLVVIDAASVSPRYPVSDVGKSVTFTCKARGVPRFYWTRDGKKLSGARYDVNSSVSGFSELTIKNLSVNDKGYYVCDATANVNQPNRFSSCLLLSDPLKEDKNCSKRMYFVAIGEPLGICCPVRGFPPPKVVWKKDGEEVKVGQETVLAISSVKSEHFGIYTCTATDDVILFGPFNITVTEELGVEIPVDTIAKIDDGLVEWKWAPLTEAENYFVKIRGNDTRDEVTCLAGKKNSFSLTYNSLVSKKAGEKPKELAVCVKVVALNENDAVIGRTSTCKEYIIKDSQVTLKPGNMLLLLLLWASWGTA